MAKLPGNLDLDKGQLLNARVENLTTLPAFIPGEDEGRILFVNQGPDLGYWFGAQDGSNAFARLTIGSTLAQYAVLSQAINDGVTFQATVVASATAAEKAFLASVQLTSGDVTSGQVRVEMYNDLGRTDKFYDAVFEMASPQIDRFPVFFEVDNSAGNIYVDVTNNSGTNGTFDLNFQAAGVIVVSTPPPPGQGSGINAGVAGDGIEFNAPQTRLDIDLLTNGGLLLQGSDGSRELAIQLDPTGGLNVNPGQGLRVDPTVTLRTGEDQTGITGQKIFSQFGLTPAGSPGAPTTGTHVQGEFHLDSNLNLFQCITGGTPGTWIFWGWAEERFGGATDGSSYTGTAVANGGTVVLEVPTFGRRGFVRKMNIWASEPARGALDIDVPFRIRCYPNENLEGREQIWSVIGMARKTFVTLAASGGANQVEVNTVGLVNLDDLVRMRQIATPLEEYQRVTVRETSPIRITVDETLVNSLAINDQVHFVTEFIDLPWRNNSGTPSEQNKIFLEFVNDDPSGGTDLIFGYDIFFENVGGGQPV